MITGAQREFHRIDNNNNNNITYYTILYFVILQMVWERIVPISKQTMYNDDCHV